MLPLPGLSSRPMMIQKATSRSCAPEAWGTKGDLALEISMKVIIIVLDSGT